MWYVATMMMNPLIIAAVATLAGAASAAPVTPPVPLHTRFEATFEAKTKHASPLHDVQVDVTFTSPSGKKHAARAFYYDTSSWKVRFAPDEAGAWTFRTVSSKPNDAGLHGQSGGFTAVAYKGSNPLHKRGPLRVSPDRRHLMHADGTPFFFLGDTVWNGPLKADMKDWHQFLRFRAAQGFNVIQYVGTHWRTASANADGRPAFYGREKIAIDPEFWKWMDERVDAINERGLVAAGVLAWAIAGDTAVLNPGQFLPDDQIAVLARYQLDRYGAHHATWFLAGDGVYQGKEAQRWLKIGRAVFRDQPPRQLVTMHAGGRITVYPEFRNEPWFAYSAYQSGHAPFNEALGFVVNGPPSKEWATEPVHPHIDLEPCYEGHLIKRSRTVAFSAFDVRRAAYFSSLVHPPAGVGYGGHGVWSWETTPRPPMTHPFTGTARPWHEAMKMPGAAQMGILRKFFESLPWTKLRPAQELISEQPGKDDPTKFIAAARTEDGRAAVIYVPTGGAVTLAGDKVTPGSSASWFDPVTGRTRPAGKLPAAGAMKAPSATQDWVLVLRTRDRS